MAFYNTLVHNRECEIEYHEKFQEDGNPIFIDCVMHNGGDISKDLGFQIIMWLEEEIFNEEEK